MYLLYIFLDSLIFFISYLLIFISISGYGMAFSSITQHNTKNIFDYYFFGFPILIILSFIIYLTIGFSEYTNLFFMLLGIIFYIKNNNINYFSLFFITLFFLGVVISKSHDDFLGYHFQFIKEIYNSDKYIGIANLDFRYSYSSALAYVQALFKFPFFDYKFIQIPIYLLYVSFIGYLFTSINFTKDKIFSYLKLVLIFLLMIKFHRFSKHGYDFAGQFISLLIFLKLFENQNNFFKEKLLIIYLFIFLILIKLNNIILFPILLLLLKKENIISIIKNVKDNKIYTLIIFLMITLFFVNNFIKSGCLFINNKDSCFSKDIISWALSSSDFLINFNGRLYDYVELVEIWSKAFFTQNYLDKDSYLNFSDFTWIKYWFKNHFIYRISDFLFIFIIINIFLLFFFRNNFFFNLKKNYIVLIPLSFVIILMWFLKIPEFRFGFGYILIFIISILVTFVNFNVNINKNFLTVSFLFLLIFFNSKNLLRIYDSLNNYKETNFKNFPWFNLVDSSNYSIIELKDNFRFYTPNNHNSCTNLPTPCSLNLNVKFNKKFIYTIISKSD